MDSLLAKTSNPTLKRDCAKARSPLPPRWARHVNKRRSIVFTRLSVTPVLAILGASLLFGCATPTRRSADIATTGVATLDLDIAHIDIVAKEPRIPIDNFQVVVQDGVYRSGQPRLDNEPDNHDWEYLKALRVKTIVKLNKFFCEPRYSCVQNEVEEIAKAEKYGMKVIPIYMQPDDWPKNWNPLAHPNYNDVMRAVEILEKRGNERVLVHCAHGKDRTGLVVAVYSVLNKNYCKDAAYLQMKYYGASSVLFGIKPILYNDNIVEKQNCTDGYVSTPQ